MRGDHDPADAQSAPDHADFPTVLDVATGPLVAQSHVRSVKWMATAHQSPVIRTARVWVLEVASSARAPGQHARLDPADAEYVNGPVGEYPQWCASVGPLFFAEGAKGADWSFLSPGNERSFANVARLSGQLRETTREPP